MAEPNITPMFIIIWAPPNGIPRARSAPKSSSSKAATTIPAIVIALGIFVEPLQLQWKDENLDQAVSGLFRPLASVFSTSIVAESSLSGCYSGEAGKKGLVLRQFGGFFEVWLFVQTSLAADRLDHIDDLLDDDLVLPDI